MKKLMMALALLTIGVLPVAAQVANVTTVAENEALRKALEQALRENIELRAEIEAARAEIDRLRGGTVRPIGMTPMRPAQPERMHLVKEGETLGTIAARYYGAVGAFTRIFEANRDRVRNPDLIFPGQNLRIP